jgi:hypothetical protein
MATNEDVYKAQSEAIGSGEFPLYVNNMVEDATFDGEEVLYTNFDPSGKAEDIASIREARQQLEKEIAAKREASKDWKDVDPYQKVERLRDYVLRLAEQLQYKDRQYDRLMNRLSKLENLFYSHQHGENWKVLVEVNRFEGGEELAQDYFGGLANSITTKNPLA